MKVKRFYYVAAPFGRVAHLLYGKRVEGEKKTACNRILTPSWEWSVKPRRLPRCKKCEQAEIA